MLKTRFENLRLWKYIFFCFSLTVLTCSLKHYLIYAIHTSESCSYLCPAFLGHNGIIFPAFLESLFTLQSWFIHLGQNLFNFTGASKNYLISSLIMAPLIEESIYRGPLFLLKNKVGCYIWWVLAIFLCVIFVLSHRYSGLPLLPLTVLGLASSWLIIKTKKFWPSLSLHFLYNFHVASFYFYQSLASGD